MSLRSLQIDKFIFRVQESYLYTTDGVWVAPAATEGVARLGLSHFRQQSSGDVAFVELPTRASRQSGRELSLTSRRSRSIWRLPCAFDGKVVAVNRGVRIRRS